MKQQGKPAHIMNRFINCMRAVTLAVGSLTAGAGTANIAHAETGWPEKAELTIGFIKLTDMAPLAIAYEKFYFEDEGLYVTLEPQANWRVLLDGLIDGRLDAAHMLAGQPLAATIGYGTQANIITPLSLDLNGNAITVSNDIWSKMLPHLETENGEVKRPVSASALRPVVDQYRQQGMPFNMGMVFPVSTHNYELRYWLAAAGIHPGFYAPHKGDTAGTLSAEVLLSVTPPPQMPATLDAGTILGYSVGEPWNQQAIYRGIGVPVITDYEIWKNNPEKVLGMTEEFARENPNTAVRLVKALLRAGKWLDAENNANREEAARILSRSEYVGGDYEVIANSMTGTFEYQKDEVRSVPDFNVFFRHHATYPYYSDAIWYLTQMRRWGQISEPKSDEWYFETAAKVYRPDIYQQAAEDLINEGVLGLEDFPDFATESGFRPTQDEFIDGIPYDGKQPNAYLQSLSIGLKDEIL